MPVVLRIGQFVFQFWASDRSEPPHVHVRAGRRKAKYWLVPEVRLARNQGFKPHELTVIRALVLEHSEFLLERWHEFFDGR
jgi:hypothetical protein